MQIRKLPVIGPTVQHLRLVVLAGLGASILAVGAGYFTANEPALDPVQDSMWKKRIRRLKLADPESSEEMLARTGLAHTMPAADIG
jgi:hypothetical protein